MRQGELAALRWEDVDLTGKPSITVRRSADTRTKTRVSTTKTGKLRKIHIGPRTVEVLKAHRARQPQKRIAASSWADPGLVFPNTRGKIRRRDSAVRSFKRYLEEAGIPTDVRFHDLRHTAGTLALRQGMPLHAVSKMLGHSDPAMTLRRYAHVLEDMEDEGGRAMAAQARNPSTGGPGRSGSSGSGPWAFSLQMGSSLSRGPTRMRATSPRADRNPMTETSYL
jgi:integrase